MGKTKVPLSYSYSLLFPAKKNAKKGSEREEGRKTGRVRRKIGQKEWKIGEKGWERGRGSEGIQMSLSK